MAAKTPKHGSKPEVVLQPAQVLTFISPASKTTNKTGSYKLIKAKS